MLHILKRFFILLMSFFLIQFLSINSYAAEDNVKFNMSHILSNDKEQFIWYTVHDESTSDVDTKSSAGIVKYTYSIEYPQFSGLLDSDIEETINRTIKERAYLTFSVAEIEDIWSFVTEYEVTFCNDNFISIYFQSGYASTYMGRFHRVDNSLNIDIQTGETVAFDEIFNVNEDWVKLVFKEENSLIKDDNNNYHIYRNFPKQELELSIFIAQIEDSNVDWKNIGDNNSYINYYIHYNGSTYFIINGGGFMFQVFETSTWGIPFL